MRNALDRAILKLGIEIVMTDDDIHLRGAFRVSTVEESTVSPTVVKPCTACCKLSTAPNFSSGDIRSAVPSLYNVVANQG